MTTVGAAAQKSWCRQLGASRECWTAQACVMRWSTGKFSESDMAHEPGLGTAKTYQPGEMPLSTRPRPACRDDIKLFTRKRVASLPRLAQFKTAVPPERARVEEEEVKTNERMEDLSDTRDELDRVRKILTRTQGDRDMWRRLPEGCNKKRGEEIGRNESGTVVTCKKTLSIGNRKWSS